MVAAAQTSSIGFLSISRRVLLFVMATALAVGAAMIVVSRFGPKRTGAPLVEFEIKLPAGILLPDDKSIGVMLWHENASSGMGCKIAHVKRSGPRPVVMGNCVVGRTARELLSLRLSWYSESYWRMPITSKAPIDPAFGSWQRIEFVQDLHKEEAPLPRGEYDVRYRVTRYM